MTRRAAGQGGIDQGVERARSAASPGLERAGSPSHQEARVDDHAHDHAGIGEHVAAHRVPSREEFPADFGESIPAGTVKARMSSDQQQSTIEKAMVREALEKLVAVSKSLSIMTCSASRSSLVKC
jgi:hypothetical protein